MAIQNLNDIDTEIAILELRKVAEQKILKQQFNETVDAFKPKNLLKAAYKSATENGGTGGLLLKAAGGIGAGVLGGKFLAGGSLLSKIAGTAINTGAVEGIINNKEKIMAWGKAIYNNILKRK